MSSFFLHSELSLIERAILRLLRQGEIPTHIGFIMDGNRRYAREREMENLVGHIRGIEKLSKTLGWCRDLGIYKVTIYAFSIENFKRPAEEVDGLMDLFCGQFVKMLETLSKFDSFQICVRFYGRLSLLPEELQETIAKVVERTAKNSRFFLNVALAYTAREEICTAMTTVKDRVTDGQLSVENITEKTLNKAMYSAGLEDPDILFRTSGEIRLSDFLLWQTSFSYIFFTKELWPEFSVWSVFEGVLHYQIHSRKIRRARNDYKAETRFLQEQEQKCSKLKKEKISSKRSNGSCVVLNGKESYDNFCHFKLPKSSEAERSKLSHLRSEMLLVVFLLLIIFCAVTTSIFVTT